MAYDSKGRLVLGHNLSTRENLDMIAECIGDFRISTLGGRDVGMLCTSPVINMWSKNKPIRRPEVKVLTAEQRAKVSFGIDMSGCSASDYETLLTKAINNNCEYGYLKPRGGDYNEPFRGFDFDGYRHNATVPYKYTFVHFDSNVAGWMDVMVSPNADLMLSEIDPTMLPSSDMSKCNLALLYRKKGTTSGGGCIFPKVDGKYITLADIENSSSAPVARFNMPAQGEYYFVAAVTDATENNMEDMYWMYLPKAIFSAKYDPSSQGFEWYYSDDYGAVGVPAYGNTSVPVQQVVVRFGLDVEDFLGSGGDLTIEIGEYDGDFIVNDSIVVEAWGDDARNDEFTFTGIGSKFPNPTIDNIYIVASLTYSEVSGSSYYDKVMYFDFIGGRQTTSYNPVSLKQIWDAWNW